MTSFDAKEIAMFNHQLIVLAARELDMEPWKVDNIRAWETQARGKPMINPKDHTKDELTEMYETACEEIQIARDHKKIVQDVLDQERRDHRTTRDEVILLNNNLADLRMAIEAIHSIGSRG